jgi:hypothetical protein
MIPVRGWVRTARPRRPLAARPLLRVRPGGGRHSRGLRPRAVVRALSGHVRARHGPLRFPWRRVLALVLALAALLVLGVFASHVSAPSIPHVSVGAPHLKVPTIHPQLPSAPSISAPSAPSISPPDVSAPSISPPDVSAPSISPPDISLPGLGGHNNIGSTNSAPGVIHTVKSVNHRHWILLFIWRLPWWPLAALLLLVVWLAGRRGPKPTARWFALALDVVVASLAIYLLVPMAVKVPDASRAPLIPRPVYTTSDVLYDGTTEIVTHRDFDSYPPPIKITVDLVLLTFTAALIDGRRLLVLKRLHTAPVGDSQQEAVRA